MIGWIDVPKIGLIRVSSIVQVGVVGGDVRYERYTVYLSSGLACEILERDMTRDSFIRLMVWEDEHESSQEK